MIEMNHTTKLIIPRPQIYALSVIVSVQIFTGFTSNVAIFATISLRQRHNKTPANITVLNRSVADLFPSLSYLPWLTFQLIHGLHNRPTECYFNSSYIAALHCSENAVLELRLDSGILDVIHYLKYRKQASRRFERRPFVRRLVACYYILYR